ncbi:primosomal replication protein N [Psychromonas sp. Urea-02u-13]|uniref:primosomal replication protein N n=1 Tax=Psychromonas sp. Urea-02u-13 TaxID=2058326 RepID=UPI000C3486FF|nr:primosomal replication protein N [Psychromonas sp. Urea-02u-13]PKG39487.1 primosomal replication protein N [Psychromonas sp. Urea-02u-13]
MTENFLRLSGVVTEKPTFKVSPSGVEHCNFTIEHRSVQKEVELPRNAFCYMPIATSGTLATQLKNTLSKGMQLRVSGFITFHKSANNVGKLVLHAQYIEQI